MFSCTSVSVYMNIVRKITLVNVLNCNVFIPIKLKVDQIEYFIPWIYG
jgi:hypothetical protein